MNSYLISTFYNNTNLLIFLPLYSFTIFSISLITFLSIITPVNQEVTVEPKSLDDKYPQGLFVFPIKPGVRASLSGSYGDIRFNHFHAGLDIRTGGVEGVPVHAAADGYVSRIGISRGGYGNALYITHSNGYTTVYGHLKEFSDNIKSKLLERQYQQKTWEIDTYFSPGEILVAKNEVVAFSGNTGGSGGPHLHFEIRNEAEETIDPSLFGFKEIVDTTSPVVLKVVLRPLNMHSRINGQFGDVTLTPIRLKNGNYVINSQITALGKVGIMLYTYDKSETSPFKLGVTSLRLTHNDNLAYSFNLAKMSFDTKMDMNLHTDYEKMVESGVKFHKLFVEEGNRMKQYVTNETDGFVEIETEKNDIEILIKDTFQNSTTLNFKVINDTNPPITTLLKSSSSYKPKILTDKFGNFLRVQAVSTYPLSIPAIFQHKGSPKSVNPAYVTANSVVYLYDLSQGLVDFVQIGESASAIQLNTWINPKQVVASGTSYQINFEKSLYSDLFLNFSSTDFTMDLGKDIYPLKDRFEVNWIKKQPLCTDCGVYLEANKPRYVTSEPTPTGVLFRPKEFGRYVILEDKEPPTIKPQRINPSELSFYINDNLSGIKNITCFVNNAWVLMEYEPKLGLIWSEKARPSVPFSGQIRLVVEDNQGNKQLFERTI